MKNATKILALGTILVTGIALTECGGSGGSSGGGSGGGGGNAATTVNCATNALCPPSQVNVVATQTTATTTNFVSLNGAPAGGAYVTDKTQFWFDNRAQDAVNSINQILCFVSKTNFSEYTNKGAYLAMVNEASCQQGGSTQTNSGSGGGQASANQAATSGSSSGVMPFIVNATRANLSSPEIVNAWVTEKAKDDKDVDKQIQVKITVRETPTTTNPYGDFTMDFVMYTLDANGNVTTQQIGGGTIYTSVVNGQTQLNFVENGGKAEMGIHQQAVTLVGTTTTGVAKAATLNIGPWGTESMNFTLAYNPTHMLQSLGSANTNFCFSRVNYDNVTQQYGVYNQDGTRLNQNAGFPIKYMKGAESKQGYLGYYGLWVPEPNNTLADGSAITKIADDGTKSPGTLKSTVGRMQLFVQDPKPLGQLAGLEFNVWTGGQNSGQGIMINTNDILKWDATNQTFVKVGSMTCSNNGCTRTSATPQNVGQLYFSGLIGQWGNQGSLNIWINGLGNGGNTQLKLFSNCSFTPGMQGMNGTWSCPTYLAPTNATVMNIWKSRTQMPTTAESTIALYCFNGCPVLANGLVQTKNPGWNIVDRDDPTQPYLTYSYKTSLVNYGLYKGATLIDGSTGSNQIWTGQLFTADQLPNLIDPITHTVNMFKVWDGSLTNLTYYTWGSSADQYNRIFMFQDQNGNIAQFDRPLDLQYTATDGSNTAFVQYMGFGQLHGIPGICLDEVGNETQCGQGTRWKPAFSIPTGSSLVDMNSSTLYWVKALAVGQFPSPETLSACSGLSLTQAAQLTLPTLNGWVPPSIGTSPAAFVPTVIDGVDQCNGTVCPEN